MAKNPHPADLAALAAIPTADHFVVNLRVDGRNEAHRLKRLDQAREAGRLMVDIHQTLTRPLIYAVTAEGRSFLVPDDYQPETSTEDQPGEATMQFEQMTAHGTAASIVGREKLYVSRDYNDKSNCRRALKAHAERANLPVESFEIIAHPGGDFCFAQVEPSPLEATLRASLPADHPEFSPLPSISAAPADTDLLPKPDPDMPDSLNRLAGMTRGDLKHQREAMAAKRAKEKEYKMPATKKIVMPKSTKASREAAAKLGMAPTALKATGAKPRAAAASKPTSTPKRASRPSAPGERNRYDWKAAEAMAAEGKLPPKLDFSAETHARFRPMLAEVEAIVRPAKKDAAHGYTNTMKIADLKKIKINPISSSPKALDRYRNACVTALKAQG